MLVKATIRDKARILLNELVAGFWTDAQLEGFIDDAAIDISTKTYCYEQSHTVTLSTGIQTYTPSISDIVKTLGAIYASKGLKEATPWMEGIETAVPTGVPKYYFEIISKIGFFPVPTVTENGTIVTVYCAITTSDITKIPLKFQVPAILYTVYMGLLKQRQYTKASQLFQNYTDSLNVDRLEVTREKIIEPPPQNHHILKIYPTMAAR